jgi:hypothetical protein
MVLRRHTDSQTLPTVHSKFDEAYCHFGPSTNHDHDLRTSICESLQSDTISLHDNMGQLEPERHQSHGYG